MKKDELIAVKIIEALNEACIGYRLDVDGEIHFFSRQDKDKADEIIKRIETE